MLSAVPSSQDCKQISGCDRSTRWMYTALRFCECTLQALRKYASWFRDLFQQIQTFSRTYSYVVPQCRRIYARGVAIVTRVCILRSLLCLKRWSSSAKESRLATRRFLAGRPSTERKASHIQNLGIAAFVHFQPSCSPRLFTKYHAVDIQLPPLTTRLTMFVIAKKMAINSHKFKDLHLTEASAR
jgi:hypothetical protein